MSNANTQLMKSIAPILVDDQEAEFEILHDALPKIDDSQYDLIFAQTVGSAELLIKPIPPNALPFVFLDLDLGANEINGIEALKSLRSLSPISIFVAYTRSKSDNVEIGNRKYVKQDLLDMGFDAFLDKQDLNSMDLVSFLLDLAISKLLESIVRLNEFANFNIKSINSNTFSREALNAIDVDLMAKQVAKNFEEIDFELDRRRLLVVFQNEMSFLSKAFLRKALEPLTTKLKSAKIPGEFIQFSGNSDIVRRCEEIVNETVLISGSTRKSLV